MIRSTVLFTINIRFVAIAFVTAVVAVLFGSWAKVADKNTLLVRAGYAAFTQVTTSHSITLDNKNINYNATTGYLPIKYKADNVTANIFYTAYTLKDNTAANRPITFLFNGGPGSASIWLHMGAFGPVRVDERGSIGNNSASWLGFTDLVFIDPVGTGYSRPADGVEAKLFFNYEDDIASIAAFIKDYLSKNNRQQSPKFLAGESYGGLRAIGLAQQLINKKHIKVSGITLISPAINYQLISFKPGNETAYAYYLPTFAVTARYHGRLPSDLESITPAQLIDKATCFAQGSYQKFLSQGDDVTTEFRSKIIDSLSYFTGLSKATVDSLNGRITDRQFTKLLLNGTGNVTGTFDGRVTGETENADPSIAQVKNRYTHAFNKYVKQQLKYTNNLPYLATNATGGWNYGPQANNSYADASVALKSLIQNNPAFQVNIVGGYYDLATPIGSTKYVINHLGLSKQLRKNITQSYYEAGHMIYTSASVNVAFKENSQAFYQRALSPDAGKAYNRLIANN
ncbi:peptidase S10 [Mucilaginibacter pallidiroseus]|uniref:Peptidase S10 n=1 Tax=Mucilaginibacter pallidiroseus TaxID=2599295 RepID=A0A563U0S3_9SPHI|nr:alpha/beta hydrolase [Mucilaginibacter pallidiroseus]TWR25153.1 peptidase S10 [Mucilaginibacter pallidiroseus]